MDDKFFGPGLGLSNEKSVPARMFDSNCSLPATFVLRTHTEPDALRFVRIRTLHSLWSHNVTLLGFVFDGCIPEALSSMQVAKYYGFPPVSGMTSIVLLYHFNGISFSEMSIWQKHHSLLSGDCAFTYDQATTCNKKSLQLWSVCCTTFGFCFCLLLYRIIITD